MTSEEEAADLSLHLRADFAAEIDAHLHDLIALNA